MSYASVTTALSALLATVPGVAAVEREEQLAPRAKGSVLPTPDRCPLVRLSVSRRVRSQERGWLLDGTRDAQTGIECNVWAYSADPEGGADSFLALVDALQRVVRAHRTLDGAADTPSSKLLQLRPVDGPALPRPLSQDGRSLFHAVFTVLCREAVN